MEQANSYENTKKDHSFWEFNSEILQNDLARKVVNYTESFRKILEEKESSKGKLTRI